MSNIQNTNRIEWLAEIQNVTPIKQTNTITAMKSPVPRVQQWDNVFTHDLHGMPINTAFHHVVDLVSSAHEYNIPQLRVITGRSGSIFREFQHWMTTWYFQQYVVDFYLEPNRGSYLLRLKSSQ